MRPSGAVFPFSWPDIVGARAEDASIEGGILTVDSVDVVEALVKREMDVGMHYNLTQQLAELVHVTENNVIDIKR